MPTNPGVTGLVSWWSLDETSGTRVDSHGSNDLTDNNTVGSATGVQGNAADFESTNSESLSITDAAQSGLNVSDFTLCGWMNPESLSSNITLAGKWTNAGFLRQYQVQYNTAGSGSFRLNCSDDGVATFILNSTSGTPSTATWYFVVAYHDATAQEVGISVNGGAFDTDTYTLGIASKAGDFRIGSRDGSNYMDGLIDEVCIYNRVLTTDEVAFLYNSGAGVGYTDVAGSAGSPLAMLAQQQAMLRAGGVPIG